VSKYFSIDTEATGLEEDTHLIQLAILPVDVEEGRIYTELGKEWLIKCPSFEELKPKLNPWVLEHNESLIRDAHSKGLTQTELKEKFKEYLESPELKKFRGDTRPLFLGKSLSALDIPLMTRYFGKKFLETYFHHHTVDITCVARGLVDAGALPEGCESTTKLLRHFQIRDDARHTALSDAEDMANAYLKILKWVGSHFAQ
jgi:hypothetical protein